MTTKQYRQRYATNRRRLAESNQELRALDLSVWQDGAVSAIDGFVLGMFITRRADGYSILFQDRTTLERVPPLVADGQEGGEG